MNIQIPNPCTESWNAMQTVNGGRFCDVCKCKVHDFTNASSDEINRQYALNNGKLCALTVKNIAVEQFRETVIRKGYFHSLKVFCLSAILAFGANLFTIPAANAKQLLGNVRSEILLYENQGDTLASGIIIKGNVRDKETKEVLIGATVQLFVNDTVVIASTVSDIEGNYVIKTDAGNYQEGILKVRYISYENTLIKVVPLAGETCHDIEMQASEQIPTHVMGISVQRIEPLIPMSEPLIKTRRSKRNQAAK